MENPQQEGLFFLETVWYSVAEKVIATAIQVYGLDERQAAALRVTFLKGNLYQIVTR
jgi:hypothetical protein